MKLEHAQRIKKLSDNYNLPIVGLFALYSKKEKDYMHRDLKRESPYVNDLFFANQYGKRAISNMEHAAERDFEGLEKLADKYNGFLKWMMTL